MTCPALLMTPGAGSERSQEPQDGPVLGPGKFTSALSILSAGTRVYVGPKSLRVCVEANLSYPVRTCLR